MIVRSLGMVVGLTAVGAGLLWGQLTAQAQTFTAFQVTNQTASNGGDFPVTDSVIFHNLVLNVLFNDTSTQNLSLFIPGDTTVQTSLDPNTFNLESAPINAAQHGGLLTATLTGTFDLTQWNVTSTPFSSTTPVVVAGNFVTVINNAATSQIVNINGVDSQNNRYAAGTLASTSTPEPSAVALLLAAGTGIVPFSLRRRARRAGKKTVNTNG
jgi:hypothetical protein